MGKDLLRIVLFCSAMFMALWISPLLCSPQKQKKKKRKPVKYAKPPCTDKTALAWSDLAKIATPRPQSQREEFAEILHRSQPPINLIAVCHTPLGR